jgi:hypothetical protein
MPGSLLPTGLPALDQFQKTIHSSDPELSKRIPGGTGEPSDVDISLLLFSPDSKHPLLTNDKELYAFSDELRAKQCHRPKWQRKEHSPVGGEIADSRTGKPKCS